MASASPVRQYCHVKFLTMTLPKTTLIDSYQLDLQKLKHSAGTSIRKTYDEIQVANIKTTNVPTPRKANAHLVLLT